jgi:hypothetical protein
MQVVRSRKVRSGVYWDTSGLWSGSSARHGKWSVAARDGGSTQVAHAHAARAQHASSEAPQALRCRTGQRIHTDGPQLHHPADPHRRHHVAGHASRGCHKRRTLISNSCGGWLCGEAPPEDGWLPIFTTPLKDGLP